MCVCVRARARAHSACMGRENNFMSNIHKEINPNRNIELTSFIQRLLFSNPLLTASKLISSHNCSECSVQM